MKHLREAGLVALCALFWALALPITAAIYLLATFADRRIVKLQ